MFKSMAMSSCIALAVILPASATERPSSKPAMKRTAATIAAPKGADRWAGFYTGAQAGFGFGNISGHDLEDGTRQKFDHTGPIGGIHAGYNFVAGAWVLGLEGEVNAAVIRGSKYDADADSSPAEPSRLRTRMPWLAAVGPRIGYAFGDVMIYAAGGIAFGRDTMKVIEDSGDKTKQTENRIGWSLGGGIEYALDKRWSVRADYRYFSLGNRTYQDPDTGDVDGVRIKADAHTFRVGLTYTFGDVRRP